MNMLSMVGRNYGTIRLFMTELSELYDSMTRIRNEYVSIHMHYKITLQTTKISLYTYRCVYKHIYTFVCTIGSIEKIVASF